MLEYSTSVIQFICEYVDQNRKKIPSTTALVGGLASVESASTTHIIRRRPTGYVGCTTTFVTNDIVMHNTPTASL